MDNRLPDLPPEAFDGEKYGTEVKNTKCMHDVVLEGHQIICKRCGAIWSGPQLARLLKAFKDER